MPQMAPLLWLILYFVVSVCLIYSVFLLYYAISINKSLKSSEDSSKAHFIWLW